MKFRETSIRDVFIVEREPFEDERGYFARFYCEEEFNLAGITTRFKQMNICKNNKQWTLRGLHYQSGKFAEDKLVSCIRGSIWDVCVDIRPGSDTFCQYVAYELSENNGKMLYIPKGCAHGYVTLEEQCQLFYMMSENYVPEAAQGYRYDDPILSIEWPSGKNFIISEKDRNLPYLNL